MHARPAGYSNFLLFHVYKVTPIIQPLVLAIRDTSLQQLPQDSRGPDIVFLMYYIQKYI